MPEFAYTARDMTGKKVSGTIEGSSKDEAAGALSSQQLFPIELKPVSGNALADLQGLFGAADVRKRRVPPQIAATFYAQLSALLRNGVSMSRALTILSEQATNKTLAEVIADLRGRVEEGEPLGTAMARYPKAFSDMAINMVRAEPRAVSWKTHWIDWQSSLNCRKI
ncbi:MAG: type II secretion system F family protein [Planctomycetota bacterium]